MAVSSKAMKFYQLGGRTFSCGVKNTYIEAREHFEQATIHDPGFARAKGWLAYTIAEGWSYGWFPDEDLEVAFELADEAVSMDPGDYQNFWSRATVRKHQGELQLANADLDQGLGLRSERPDPDLLVESSETLVYLGSHGEALDRINQGMNEKANVRAGDQTMRVPHPDWYYWDLAWASYFHARTQEAGEPVLQQALNALDTMAAPPNNSNLLRAAIQFRLGNQESAEAAMAAHQAVEPEWNAVKEADAKNLAEEADMAHWMDALIGAGLPNK